MSWWERANHWVVTYVFPIDLLGTVLLLLVSVPVATGIDSTGGTSIQLWSGAVIAPLAWRRARPVASAAAVFVVGLAHLLAGYPLLFPADVAVLLALYSVTVHGPRWAHRTAFSGALAGSFMLGVAMFFRSGSGDFASASGSWMFASVTASALWAFGLVRRSRQETINALRDRAERLEVERDQQTQLATSVERARIAREMHDIVAHSLSVIIAQADGGRYVAQGDPDAAGRSLGTIAETGRAALADMRRLLGVLRVRDDATSVELVPQPAADDLERLVEQMRASGMRVSLVRMGAVRPLPPGAELVAYRICQESLTNVLKHAGPDPRVTVLLQWLPAALTLEVTDDGRGAAALADSDGHGQGLVGMHERAAMLGGALTAGPRAGGGFLVRAELPLPVVL